MKKLLFAILIILVMSASFVVASNIAGSGACTKIKGKDKKGNIIYCDCKSFIYAGSGSDGFCAHCWHHNGYHK